MDGFQRLYETARALGEETRFRIYEELYRADGPLAVSDLARKFSLHPNAIRQHLARLEQAELVVSRAERGSGGAGRPRRLYEPSPQPVQVGHPPGSLRSMAEMLAAAVAELPGDDGALLAFGHRWGRSWARDHAPVGPAADLRGAIALQRELRRWGWQPSATQLNGRIRVRAQRCLFAELAPGGECCGLEEGVLRGLAESLVGADARVARSARFHLEVSV